jgi:hypothetical protein
MTVDPWTPLSVRRNQRDDFGPIDGVPTFMRRSINKWINNTIEWVAHDGQLPLVAQIALELRIDELGDYIDNFHPGDAIIACIQNSSLWGNIYDESRALDVIDWLLGHGFGHAQPLEHILKSAGHVLRVSPDGNRLVERIEPTLWNEYEWATQPDDQASQYMQEAWALAFGRNPNVGDAWSKSIKAIETLLKPIVSPSDDNATLGKMIGALRQAPDKWKCKLPDREYKANGEINVKPGIEVFIDVLATIGYQPDRHGSDQPQDVDETTARSVLFLATTVVGWLRDGALVLADETLAIDK